MAFCLECKKKLCPLCKGKHDTSHNLINYNQINFICQKHNDFFLKYCNKCNLNICMSCEEEHEDHDTLYFGSIIPKEKDLKNYIEELTKYKNILNEECEIIINAINKVKKNFEIYYKIKKDMIDNYDKKNKNYYVFYNMNEIIKDDGIINDINTIKNEISIENKFNYLMKIYNDMNNKESKISKLSVNISKENEELKRKIDLLKGSLEEQKEINDKFIEIRKNYELINKIIMSGIDKKTKISKYNMANKCLLTELVLSGYDKTKFITTEKVANVMLEVDRFDFAPNNPYLNRPIYLGFNVTISAPHMHAFALEHLAPYCTEGAKILDVGSGSGYLTVALSKLTNDTGVVVGVEHIPELYNFGLQNVKKHHANLLDNKKVIFVNEDGRSGCKEYGPYKAIHVGAASEQLPQELIDQLDYNGRMFIPIGPRGKTQNIYLIDKDYNGKITYKSILSVCYGMLTDKATQLQN
jgi:protein-L-isoaspartate(D-aspartate) O-methyltransferase